MHLVRFFPYIFSCLSVAYAFNVTVGTPTQCGPLTVSWTGGQAPFEILLNPSAGVYQNYSVPSSAFSNGEGSFSIPQLALSTGAQFLLTMSDSTGFGSGGTTDILTVKNPTTNNNCNTTYPSVPFEFTYSPPVLPTQCSQLNISTFDTHGSVVPPITIVQLIPGGRSTVSYSNNDSYAFVVDVSAGTDVLYFVTDSQGNQGGDSPLTQVSQSSDSSCLNANSPSSTSGTSATSTASPSSSSSSPSSSPSGSTSSSTSSNSSHSNVALVAGAAGGGGAVLIALVILGMCLWRRRRASRSPDIQSSTTSHPHLLPYTDQKHEASHYSDVPSQSPFPYTRSIQPSPRTQSDFTNSSTGNFALDAPASSFNQTQHSRQSSNTDSPVYDPPIQSGSKPSPINVSDANLVARELPTSLNQAQNSRQIPDTDSLAVYGAPGSHPGASASAQTAATAAGQTSNRPPRIIVHIDADDVVPDDNSVIELPPQYSEHRGAYAL